MNRQITTIFMAIFLLTTISAIYAGESFLIDLGQDYEYYSIVGNNSEVVLDIQQNGTILTITPDKYSIDDTYEIVFFNKEKETIYVSSGGGGGGGSSRVIYRNITEYQNVTEYVDKIIESEPKTITEIIKEYVPEERKNMWIMIVALVLLVIALLIWNIKRTREYTPDEDYNTYTNEKEVNQNEQKDNFANIGSYDY